MIENKLELSNLNSGYFAMQGLCNLSFFLKVFNFPALARSYGLNIPFSGLDNWRDHFSDVDLARLNSTLIRVTVPGHAYADYGPFSLIWFLGAFSGRL